MSLVIGTLKRANAAAYIGDIVFRPLNTPLVDTPVIVGTDDIEVATDVTGFFTTTLLVGRYKVYFAEDNKGFKISVPDDAATHNIIDLLVDPMPPPFSVAGGGIGPSVPLATNTVPGIVQLRVAGPALVYDVNDADATFIPQLPANGTFRMKLHSGGSTDLQFWDPTDGLWHSLLAFNGQLALSQPGEA